ncbi:LysR family transcriptional regulator [Mesorhizobium sp. CU2]|uniref:LysR substrate-binding domain-containing protein n=2 Tax=unclassified Mesorhizobium TaxID=325217 RepID=UPI0011291795|nr:LysR substrate-binding domain-containing protein [Mesorhizobium sp. CU2]TPN76161.1 LysR family transcriptional regulator [Mesorhizobium sp. CU3]TPO10722.1 LysR family transcriptional regulator [Mesorhizobium sp. CU2]
MTIDLRQMRYFVALAETLHFGRAAERLHISQPPLTRQIAALERELGVRLLERNSRHAGLTHAGRRFLEDSRLAMATFEQACRNAQLAERGELGTLTVGFMMHAAHTVLPRLTRQFMNDHPDVHVELREMVPDLLPDAILTGRFDAAVTFDPGAIRGLSTDRIHEEQLCLVAHSSHRLAALPIVRAEQLAGEPLIATPPDVAPTLRDAILRYLRSAGIVPVFRLEAQLQQTIVSLVAENLGVALVPASMGKLGLSGLAFRPLEQAPTVAHVVAWRDGNMNPTLRPFLASAGVPESSASDS